MTERHPRPSVRGGLVTLGEAMVTLTTVQVGLLRHGRTMSLSMAGSEATVAIAVTRLGHHATWVSRLGDDEPGELVLHRLRGEGVDVVVERGPGPTGLMLKETPRAGVHRVHYHRAGAAASSLAPDDLPAGLVEAASILHVTGITPALGPAPRATVTSAVARAKAAGVRVTLDVNHRSLLWSEHDLRRHVGALLPEVDLVVAGTTEARLLLETEEPDAAVLARELARLTAAGVVVTAGAEGAVVAEGGRLVVVPAVPVREADPFGAGDAFVGGTLSGLLDGLDLVAAAARGATVAAMAVSAPGDWEGLPTRAEIEAHAGPDIRR